MLRMRPPAAYRRRSWVDRGKSSTGPGSVTAVSSRRFYSNGYNSKAMSTAQDSIVTRFAPSPTGSLHLGNARTAFFCYLWARKAGGRFILRIEDTDLERSQKRYRQGLLDDLHWLGLDWDEGPDVGGPAAPYNQAERGGLYAALFERLAQAGQAY